MTIKKKLQNHNILTYKQRSEMNSLEEMYLTLEENDKRIERQRMREKGEEKKERG